MRERDLVSREGALRKLEILKTFGRYRTDIVEHVRQRLEAKK
jgi:hypothetical protein